MVLKDKPESLPDAEPSRPKVKPRGFAAMAPEKQKQIASLGGKAAHARGTANEFQSQTAKAAGRKGGLSVSKDREHMSRIGALGGKARARRLRRGRSSSRVTEDPAPVEPDPDHQRLWTGASLRRRREAAGLSRSEVARRSNLSEVTIRNVEGGRHKVSNTVLRCLASVAQLAPDQARA